MVMFNCNRCSKGLKRKDVLTHSYQCGGKNKISLTCIDCLKDFIGDAYEAHTSCVTEQVRYGGKDVVAKEAGKKQNKWLGIVRQVLNSNQPLDQDVSRFLKSVQSFDNIPRQKNKFHNWAKSAMRVMDIQFLDRVFDILQMEFKKATSSKENEETPKKESSAIAADEDVPLNGSGTNRMDESSASVEANGESPKKMKKKKKNKTEVEKDIQPGKVEENGVNGLTESTNGEKKRKSRTSEGELGETTGEFVEEDEILNGNDEDAKPKKKKKKTNKKGLVAEEEQQVEEADPPNDVSSEGGDKEGNTQKLSKKEKKLKKKKAKFEAEIQAIENFKKDEFENAEVEEEGKKSKKSKKRKLVDESSATDSASNKLNTKDSKKQKLDEDCIDENGKDDSVVEPEVVSTPKKEKFDWFGTIIQVLKKSKKDEVSVKKVTKKVIDEYVFLYGDKGIHEKLNAKMAKKLKNCPGIRVLKDKVKLLASEE